MKLFCLPTTLVLALLALTTPQILSAAEFKEQLPIQHGITYQEPEDINQYWVSEKLDGIRGYWNGNELLTRNGHRINVPHWFTANWPDIPLDGELWLGRAQFERIAALVLSKQDNEDSWRDVRFMLFDLPADKRNFSARIIEMNRRVKQANSVYLQVIAQQKFHDIARLMAYLDTVMAHSGEGLMLHHEKAFYHAGRNSSLMKLKKHQDGEATVVAHLPGQGKYQTMLGAITVKTAEGIVFNIGSGFTDLQRQHPPAINSTITYKYFGKTAQGVPKFASFVRIRPSQY